MNRGSTAGLCGRLSRRLLIVAVRRPLDAAAHFARRTRSADVTITRTVPFAASGHAPLSMGATATNAAVSSFVNGLQYCIGPFRHARRDAVSPLGIIIIVPVERFDVIVRGIDDFLRSFATGILTTIVATTIVVVVRTITIAAMFVLVIAIAMSSPPSTASRTTIVTSGTALPAAAVIGGDGIDVHGTRTIVVVVAPRIVDGQRHGGPRRRGEGDGGS